MAGLLDIVPPAPVTVEVRGVPLDVRGLSIATVAGLVMRFPALRGLLSGQDDAPMQILAMGDQIVGAVIAAGCGRAGDVDAEAFAASSLALDEQIELLAAIAKQTMPRGVDPFLESLAKLGLARQSDASATT